MAVKQTPYGLVVGRIPEDKPLEPAPAPAVPAKKTRAARAKKVEEPVAAVAEETPAE